MNKVKVIRFYFMAEYKPTVIDSQVFSWLNATKSDDFTTRLISVIRHKKNKIDDERREVIEKKTGIQYSELLLIDIPLIREGQLFFYVLYLYLTNLRFKKIVFQSRFLNLWYIIFIMKRFPRISCIYEARGSAVSEYSYVNNKELLKNSRKLDFVRLKERLTIKNSNKIISVSNNLKEYFINEYKIFDKNKIQVIPGVADSDEFYFNKELRKKIRSSLKIEDKVAFLYAGRLDKPWQVPEDIFTLFSNICYLIPNAFFIVLTPDFSIAHELFYENRIGEERYLIDFVDSKDLNRLLNASDFGVLLREDRPINNYASPTKFSEYVLTGLKTIISPNIGDFSEYVKENDCGVVLPNLNDFDLLKDILNKDFSNDERNRISKLGMSKLSKQVFIEKMKIYILGK